MAYAIFRTEKIKSVMTATKRCQHNLRTHGAAIGDRDDADEANRLVIIPGTPTEQFEDASFKEFFAFQTKDLKVRKNATVGFEAILTHSPDVEMDAATRELWIEENVKFLCDIYGKHNLYQVVVHFTEKTPHIHAVMGCIAPDGRLAASKIIKSPAHLREIQDEYAKRMEPFNLERGKDSRITRKRRSTLREWQTEQVYNAEKLAAYEATFSKELESIDKQLEFCGNMSLKNEKIQICNEHFCHNSYASQNYHDRSV